MRILFVSGRPHFPQALGGVSITTHDLALQLQKQGHAVAVLAHLAPAGVSGFALRLRGRLTGGALWADGLAGYPTYRVWSPISSLRAVVERFRPDVAVVQIGRGFVLAQALREAGVPVLYFLHNVDMDEHGGDLGDLGGGVRFVANSRFTAERYRSVFGIESLVIPPQFMPDRYRTARAGSRVTFINPYPSKGQRTALEIARLCPDIPFEFVESWPLNRTDWSRLAAEAKVLGNVTLRRRTRNIRTVYARAKFLIAPSVAEEAWGRVVTEAQFSGIPTIAARIGGLPEAVGPGGALLDPGAPADEWAEVVRRLWSDPVQYETLSDQALAHARRSEIDPQVQMSKILEAMADVRASAAPGTRPDAAGE